MITASAQKVLLLWDRDSSTLHSLPWAVRATGLPRKTASQKERRGGRRAGKQGKFTLFNLRHPGKARDTSTGTEKPLDLDRQR